MKNGVILRWKPDLVRDGYWVTWVILELVLEILTDVDDH